MAYQTATVYPDADLSSGRTVQTSWQNARDTSTSTLLSTSSLRPVASWRTSGRGGISYTNYRYFANFDLKSALPYGAAIMSLKMYIWFDNTDGEMYFVKHSRPTSLISSNTYGKCIYTSGGTNSNGDMIALADEFSGSVSIPANYHVVTLNSTAIDLANDVAGTDGDNSGMFCIALITKKDYDDGSPSNTTSFDSDVYTDAYTGTSRDPKLVIEYENPPTIGLGANF